MNALVRACEVPLHGSKPACLAVCLGLLLATTLLCAPHVRAHTRSVSYSSWTLDDEGASVTLRLTQLELTRLPWGPVPGPDLNPELAAYLTGRVQLLAAGELCSLQRPPRVLDTPADRVAIEWRLRCPGDGPREIRSRLMHEVAPSHLHFARIKVPGGAPLERVLSAADPGWPLPSEGDDDGAEPRGSSLKSYILLGIEHIGTGPDHLAFVLALILIAARLGEVATVITGFTIAHSITLGIAVLGLATPESEAVGALVGLSILLVAAENAFLLSGRPRSIPLLLTLGLAAMTALALLGLTGIGVATLAGMTLFTLCYFGLLSRTERPARLRFAIAFAFGLVHGFGFAGVLIDIALPTGRLIPALLGFNLGVEIGQLVLVLAIWPLLRDLSRLREGVPHRLLVEAGSAGLCTVGLIWFLTRAL
jgi:hypothetical protein